MRTAHWVSLALWLTLASALSARDIHVHNQLGDDGATGHHAGVMADRTGPVRSLAKALRLASIGDRVILANTGQPYRESVSLVGSSHSGSPGQPFQIEGNGAVLDGSAPVPSAAWELHRGPVFRFRPVGKQYQQLFLDDRPLPRVVSQQLAEGPPKLEPREWCLHRGMIYFCVEKDRMPQDYRLRYAGLSVGLTLFHVQWVRITNLTVQGFQLDGINAFNSARAADLTRVTCRGNGRSGVAVGGACRVDLTGCVVGNNGVAQLLTLPLSETSIHQCELLSNTAPAWVDQGGRVFVDGQEIRGGLDQMKLGKNP